MKSKWRKNLLSIVNLCLTIGLVFFAYHYGSALLAEADFSGLAGRWWILAIAGLAFGGYYIIAAAHWYLVCRIADPLTPPKQVLAYAASQPYKYLPTSIFSFSFRAKYAHELGLGLKKSSYAQLIENFNILGSGVVVALLFLAFYWSNLLGIFCIILGAMLVYVVVKYRVVIYVPFTKRKRKLQTYRLLPSFAVMMLAWTMSGFAFLLTNYALGYSINPLLAISATAAGFVVSILAVFAPGGVGVRELTLALFGMQSAPIVLWRLLTFVMDIVVGFGAVIAIRLKYGKDHN